MKTWLPTVPDEADALGSVRDHRRHAGDGSDDHQAQGSPECRSPRLPFVKTGSEPVSRSLHSLDLSRLLDQALPANGICRHRSGRSRGISAHSPIRLERAENPKRSGGVISGGRSCARRRAPWSLDPGPEQARASGSLFDFVLTIGKRVERFSKEHSAHSSFRLQTGFIDGSLTKYLARIGRT